MSQKPIRKIEEIIRMNEIRKNKRKNEYELDEEDINQNLIEVKTNE
jgi:hypothetical protein